jgi:hypothetical protein
VRPLTSWLLERSVLPCRMVHRSRGLSSATMGHLRPGNGSCNPSEHSVYHWRIRLASCHTQSQKPVDAFYPPGFQSYFKASFLKKISDAAIDTMVSYCAQRPSPICHLMIEHTLGGTVSRRDREAPRSTTGTYSIALSASVIGRPSPGNAGETPDPEAARMAALPGRPRRALLRSEN